MCKFGYRMMILTSNNDKDRITIRIILNKKICFNSKNIIIVLCTSCKQYNLKKGKGHPCTGTEAL